MAAMVYDSNVLNLILLLCRDELTAEEKIKAEDIAAAVTDWELFSDLALKNGVAALVWYNISGCGARQFVPDSVRHFLEGALKRTIVRVEYISAKAGEISKILEEEGIKAVMLKGLALEHTVYGNKGLRQMSDADILVSPAQCIKAWNILKKNGFTSNPMKSLFHKVIMIHIGNHLPELHKGGISVDIHHRLFYSAGTGLIADAIDKAELIDISGNRCYILPPRIAFLAMINHLLKHNMSGEFQVRLYTDLYLMLKYHKNAILCPELLAEADKTGLRKELAAALYLVNAYWDYRVAEDFFTAITPQERQAYGELFYKGLKRPGQKHDTGRKELYSTILSGIPGLGNKILFLLGDVFPSVAFMKKRYGCRNLISVISHYPYRLGKIVWFINALTKKPTGIIK